MKGEPPRAIIIIIITPYSRNFHHQQQVVRILSVKYKAFIRLIRRHIEVHIFIGVVVCVLSARRVSLERARPRPHEDLNGVRGRLRKSVLAWVYTYTSIPILCVSAAMKLRDAVEYSGTFCFTVTQRREAGNQQTDAHYTNLTK